MSLRLTNFIASIYFQVIAALAVTILIYWVIAPYLVNMQFTPAFLLAVFLMACGPAALLYFVVGLARQLLGFTAKSNDETKS